MLISCQKFIERTLVVANQFMIILVILFIDFNSDELVLFEVVIYLKELQKIWIQVVPNSLSFAQAVPDCFILRLKKHHSKRIGFAYTQI